MKATLIVLVALLIATPALAVTDVSVTCHTDGEDPGVARIEYAYSGDGAVRAFGLKVSVDGGATIDAISDYKTGESSQYGTRGYGIFPGSINLDDPENPQWNDPIAPDTDRGAEGTGTGTDTVILEMGSLYAGGEPNAPDASGILCRLTVSGDCTMTIEEEQSVRGGIVLEDPPGAEPDGTVTLGTCPIVVHVDCFPSTHSKYTRWATAFSANVPKPDCWCDPPEGTGYQCYADGAQDKHFLGYRVYTTDLNVLSGNWMKKDTDPTLNPCADYARDKHFLGYAVYTTDLNKLATYWMKKDTDLVPMCESVDP